MNPQWIMQYNMSNFWMMQFAANCNRNAMESTLTTSTWVVVAVVAATCITLALLMYLFCRNKTTMDFEREIEKAQKPKPPVPEEKPKENTTTQPVYGGLALGIVGTILWTINSTQLSNLLTPQKKENEK